MDILQALSDELKISLGQIEKTVALIDEGNTIPFIARYRKEVTGSLDDTVLRTLSERLAYLRGLEKRKEEVRASIEAQGKLTDEILAALDGAKILTEVEDIYRPFRPKRKTRASVAREKGLEPLAALIAEQLPSYKPSLEIRAKEYINAEKGVESAEDALSGACDIIAEDVSDNAEFRKALRRMIFENGTMTVKGTKEEDSVYANYYDFSERLKTLPGHRLLAINRGAKEEFLAYSLTYDADRCRDYLLDQLITERRSPALTYLSLAVSDGFVRLIAPSVEREIFSEMFDRACEGALVNFSMNLRNLLLQPPIKGKTVLGLDPGYRTGCKLAVVDKTGKVLDTAVIYPTKPQERIEEARRITVRLIEKYGVNIIAIGNGTASRESENFVADTIRELAKRNIEVKYMVVSEAGASVYSASELGAEEFPDFDVTQRSAVSIARRLQDPLAELVKIDPKSIGVGQYQHDMKPARLDEALAGVVEDCVNSVGVDLNTASHSLLSHIAGINAASAKNIVAYREENGEFTARSQLKKIPRIGAKAYEQCAGFLRVPGAKEVLDNTGVHPESYAAAKSLLERYGYTAADVKDGKLDGLRQKAEKEGVKQLAEALGVGAPTLLDIIGELEKPGRDLRDDLPPPILRGEAMDLDQLAPGMELTGTVRNVTDFGAFVDIGVHQDGLVHISQLCSRFVKHPSEVVSVGDIVTVRVLSVDVNKKRVALTMKL